MGQQIGQIRDIGAVLAEIPARHTGFVQLRRDRRESIGHAEGPQTGARILECGRFQIAVQIDDQRQRCGGGGNVENVGPGFPGRRETFGRGAGRMRRRTSRRRLCRSVLRFAGTGGGRGRDSGSGQESRREARDRAKPPGRRDIHVLPTSRKISFSPKRTMITQARRQRVQTARRPGTAARSVLRAQSFFIIS